MSLEDFIAHLPSQPWASAYIHNFLVSTTSLSTMAHPIASAFGWSNTPEEKEFWSALHKNYPFRINTTRGYFKSELLKLKDTHPELFI